MPPPSRLIGSAGKIAGSSFWPSTQAYSQVISSVAGAKAETTTRVRDRVFEELVEAVVDALRVERLVEVAGCRQQQLRRF
jgi:hypothetical protein